MAAQSLPRLPARSEVRRGQAGFGAGPLIVLPVSAWLLAGRSAPWLLMWALAASIYAGLKWLTWWRARQSLSIASRWRSFAYLVLWPGMDAPRFLGRPRHPARPSVPEFAIAFLNLAIGALLFWGLARLAAPRSVLLAGWIGLVGLALMLHFAAFRLCSMTWRWFGVDATPLMQAPILARSLGELWAKRWNTAFNVLARDFIVAPLRHRLGPAGALMTVFLASGLVHDLVISVPARGGYGLPTAYFLLQGLGILVERSAVGRRIGLSRGIRGRVYAIAVPALPAIVLFHPPFVLAVFIPFMRQLGALQ